ncbi:MAG: hypothetical protein ACQCXQ_10435 [Verrucomicrobiales bacterium]|nr:hypothetical protein [Verrucomicrobiota bacterium JB025]
MSKSTENVLLVPGESSWEIWTRNDESGFTLQGNTETTTAGEITKIPSGVLTLLFPVKSLTAVPMRVASDDESLFPDLANMQAERLGIRPDPMAGQLSDVFIIDREDENTALLSVFLRTPQDGELPPRSPKGFDISPRSYPVDGNTLAIWREFGRWVFALYHESKLVFCQATTETSPDPGAPLAREIKLSMMQLGMQNLNYQPTRILVWTPDSINPAPLRAAFTIPIETAAKPAPVIPSPVSKLLPADVRAARRAALKRRNIILASAAVALLYLGVIGWFGYDLWKTSAETQRLVQKASQIGPEGLAYADHIARWDELEHAIDLTHSPVDILYRIASCIPARSGLRLTIADISATQIKLTGEAPQFQSIKTFSLKLSKHRDLANFQWQTPEPSQGKTGWKFVYTGEVPLTPAQP